VSCVQVPNELDNIKDNYWTHSTYAARTYLIVMCKPNTTKRHPRFRNRGPGGRPWDGYACSSIVAKMGAIQGSVALVVVRMGQELA